MMSSVASLHVLKSGDLPAIVGAGPERVHETIEELSREPGDDYGWSGYVMVNVLDGLDALDISLESAALHEASEAINAHYDLTVLISSDAKAFLDRLDPAAYEPADLLDGPIELELDDEEAGYALTETLSLLRDTIAGLADDEVLLLHIG
jgi:hypothetical protein